MIISDFFVKSPTSRVIIVFMLTKFLYLYALCIHLVPIKNARLRAPKTNILFFTFLIIQGGYLVLIFYPANFTLTAQQVG